MRALHELQRCAKLLLLGAARHLPLQALHQRLRGARQELARWARRGQLFGFQRRLGAAAALLGCPPPLLLLLCWQLRHLVLALATCRRQWGKKAT